MPLGMRTRIMKWPGRGLAVEDADPLQPLLVVVGDRLPALAREADEVLVTSRPSFSALSASILFMATALSAAAAAAPRTP